MKNIYISTQSLGPRKLIGKHLCNCNINLNIENIETDHHSNIFSVKSTFKRTKGCLKLCCQNMHRCVDITVNTPLVGLFVFIKFLIIKNKLLQQDASFHLDSYVLCHI